MDPALPTGEVDARHWPLWLGAATVIALAIVFLPLAFGRPPAYTGDTSVYSAAMDLMFSGRLPYLDFRFEHLPLAILPMAAAHSLAELSGLRFVYPFMVITLAMVFATGVLVVRIGDRLGLGNSGLRWVAMVAPMLLITPFRVDALSVLLAVAALSNAIAGREGPSFAAASGGVLAKGWPVVLAASDWWRGRRDRAARLIVFTSAIGVLMLAMPGFRAGRSFVGIHQETLSGSLIIVWRLLLGSDAQIVDSAGALYVEAGGWAILLNVAIGAAVGLAALTALRHSFSWEGAVALTGALTLAALLASPLLSVQFLLWPIPFIALTGSRRGQVLVTGAAVLSVALVGLWSPELLWWHSGWLVRDAVLVAAAIVAVRDARVVAARYEPTTSRKNLPV